MPLPITIPNTFANATATIPLSQLDNNFSTVAVAVNSIGNGAFTLANAQITGGTISNVTLDNVSVDVETLSNVTITNLTVNGNATLTNAAVTANVATITTANITDANVTNMVTGNATITGGTINVASVIATDDVTVGDDLVFTGTGNRIIGDFTNATQANRVFFQTSTVNGSTIIASIPNGTGTTSGLVTYNNSDPTNASTANFAVVGTTDARIQSAITGTGTYLPMTFYTGGSERMRIDTSGNVGINITPGRKLDVAGGARFLQDAAGTTGAIILRQNTGDTVGGYIQWVNNANSAEKGWMVVDTSSNMIFATVSTERMRIDSSGNVGIGTSSPATRLHVAGATTATSQVTTQHTGSAVTTVFGCDGGIDAGAVYVTTNHPLTFKTNNTERARITSAGKILFNTTTQNNNEQVGMVYSSNAGVGFSIKDSDAQSGNTFIEFRNGATLAGTITSNGTTTMTYGSASDYRLKENLVPLNGALAKVAALQPKAGNWKVDGSEFVGFLAHELQEVFPDAVVGEKDRVDADGNPLHQMVDTGSASIIATLAAAIQELKAELDATKAEVAALKGA